MIQQFHLGVHPKELKTGTQIDICTPTSIAPLFTIARKVEVTQMSIDRRQMNGLKKCGIYVQWHGSIS